MRRFVALAMLMAVPLIGGCAAKGGVQPGASSGAPSVSGTASAAASATAQASADDRGNYTVRYGFAVPSTKVTVASQVTVPIPGAIPLPYLVEIHTGDHSNENPGYARISFYFRGGFPGYNIQYVPQVISDAKGDPVPLTGNAFLRLQFTDAQAHDANGASSVTSAASQAIGFANLKSYAFAGDFEGYLTFGLGLQVAPGSDQALAVRIGELRKSDGKGGDLYVIAVDIRNG